MARSLTKRGKAVATMPGTRVAFQDPESGRFISADRALELENARRLTITADGTRIDLLHFGEVEADFEAPTEPNWDVTERTWAHVWDGGDDGIDLSALSVAEAPEGAVNFRVVAHVANNPDYPEGYATSDWMGMDQFPPNLTIFEGRNPTGIAQIFFEKPR